MENMKKMAVVAAFAVSLSGFALAQKVFTSVKVPGSSPNSLIGINNEGRWCSTPAAAAPMKLRSGADSAADRSSL